MPVDIDVHACLQKGLIGGIGAIPGTCGSHPFDVLKIRMQVRGDRFGSAVKAIHAGDLRNFYRGFFPAIEQRLITRGPMFLVSELYTQVVQQNTGLSKTQSTYVGSCGSGFTTGFLAGIAEYRKKLLSQNVVTKEEARWGNLLRTAQKAGTLPYVMRRLVAAGCCSATYDSFFFGTQAFLAQTGDFGPGLSYGCAAVVAVVAAFAFDTAVTRMMVVPPQTPCNTFVGTLKDIFGASAAGAGGAGSSKNDGGAGRGGTSAVAGSASVSAGTILSRAARGYRGLSARSVEFFINYSITGMTSVYVVMAFNALSGKHAG